MREIKTHKVAGLNESLRIECMDEAGTKYQVYVHHNNEWAKACRIEFQNTPITAIEGVTGISNEALLAILLDRLQVSKPSENNVPCVPAIQHCQEALLWMQYGIRSDVK